ncbi:MAG TPA: methyltransferase domain-containing protein, partial [Thermoanaerobaculia bacterium]|nr:methyltransferase domain-containing protein [Thermoanaerobaculia bacterium]
MPRHAHEIAVEVPIVVPGAEQPAQRPPPGFDPRLFSRLAALEATHFWFGARRRAVAPLLAQLTAGLSPGYRVLEVGCGTGGTLGLLREVCRDGRVLGFDLELAGLAFACGRTAAGLLQADLTRPPFNQEFAVICLFDVLEHIPEEQLVLRNLFQLLAKGGSLLLTVPASPALWSYFDVAVHHQRRYRAADLADRLAAAGFEVEYL